MSCSFCNADVPLKKAYLIPIVDMKDGIEIRRDSYLKIGEAFHKKIEELIANNEIDSSDSIVVYREDGQLRIEIE